jgi:hypothetical protein
MSGPARRSRPSPLFAEFATPRSNFLEDGAGTGILADEDCEPGLEANGGVGRAGDKLNVDVMGCREESKGFVGWDRRALPGSVLVMNSCLARCETGKRVRTSKGSHNSSIAG